MAKNKLAWVSNCWKVTHLFHM